MINSYQFFFYLRRPLTRRSVVYHIIMNLSLTRTGCLSLELPIDGTHFTLVLKPFGSIKTSLTPTHFIRVSAQSQKS